MATADGHQFDPHGGEEYRKTFQTLSARAIAGSQPIAHWRGRVEEAPAAIIGEGGLDYEAAFFLCQTELEPWIVADSFNPFNKSKYTSLAPLLVDVRRVIKKNFITVKQYPGKIHRAGIDGGKQYFLPYCTKLTHVPTGQFEIFVQEFPLNKMDAQEIGTIYTYARRYGLLGIFGIASTDDDAAYTVLKRTLDADEVESAMKLLLAEIAAATHKGALKAWAKKDRDLSALPEDRRAELKAVYSKKLADLPDAAPTTKSTK